MRLHGEAQVTTLNTAVKVLSVPSNSVVELKSIVITNTATANATIAIWNGDGTDTDYDYRIMTVIVPAGSTLTLDENLLVGVRAFKDIYVITDQNIFISIVAEAK